MEDMGVKSMQKSMHDQNSKLQQLYADAESMKQTNMEEFDEPLHAIEKLIYEIENHISTVKTAGETMLPNVTIAILCCQVITYIVYLFIWGFTSLSTLYRSYHDG